MGIAEEFQGQSVGGEGEDKGSVFIWLQVASGLAWEVKDQFP